MRGPSVAACARCLVITRVVLTVAHGNAGTLVPAFSFSGRRRHRLARFLILQLQAVERGVAAALAQQFLVPAGFGDRALLDHDRCGRHARPCAGGARSRWWCGLASDARSRPAPAARIRNRAPRSPRRAGSAVRLGSARARPRHAGAGRRRAAGRVRRPARRSRDGKRHDEIVRMRGLGGGDDLLLRSRPRLPKAMLSRIEPRNRNTSCPT